MTEHLRTRSDGGRAVEYPPPPEPLRSRSTTTTRTSRSPTARCRSTCTSTWSARHPSVSPVRCRWARMSRRAAGRPRSPRASRACWPPSRCTRTRRPSSTRPATLDEALAVIDELAALPRVRAVGETGLDFYPHRRRGPRCAVPLVRGAHRDREAARPRPADPRPRRARRGRRDPATGGRARAHGVPLLLGRRGARPARGAEGWYCSFAGNVTFKNAASLREALRVAPARPHPRRDGRAVPHARAAAAGAPTRRTSCPTPCGSWRPQLDADSPGSARSSRPNTERVYGSWSDGLAASDGRAPDRRAVPRAEPRPT